MTPAAAAPTVSIPLVGLTVTPATAVVGDQVTVAATLTNNTSATVSAALGIENPQYASQKITGVGGSGCARRNLQRLIYMRQLVIGPRRHREHHRDSGDHCRRNRQLHSLWAHYQHQRRLRVRHTQHFLNVWARETS
ncbi:hypothetical protein [Fodinicola feengrottensis]|uniref:hypothetical protein n=1 Tax=Fodinicola feengrottensis TaxID=435914 RepID=UPI0013D00136|nr:hypothetical protein [Fodinicola feengrottensis]